MDYVIKKPQPKPILNNNHLIPHHDALEFSRKIAEQQEIKGALRKKI